MTRGDLLIIVTVVAVALLSAPTAGALLAPGAGSAVLRGPGGATSVDLSVPGRYVVPGRTGDVVFEVAEGSVFATSAECPDHLCVHMGSAAPGRPVVCAPNGVSATLTSQPGEGFDAVSR